MGTHNFEQSNVILLIYKQVCIFVGILLLFLFGMDTARNYILPPQWKVGGPKVQSTPPSANN
jgi:hypothetical protein